MADKLFDTEQKKKDAINALESLIATEGWKLILQIFDRNIEVATNHVINGIGEGETKEDIDLLRHRLKIYEECRDTPTDHIKRLQTGEVMEEPELDPYPQTPPKKGNA